MAPSIIVVRIKLVLWLPEQCPTQMVAIAVMLEELAAVLTLIVPAGKPVGLQQHQTFASAHWVRRGVLLLAEIYRLILSTAELVVILAPPVRYVAPGFVPAAVPEVLLIFAGQRVQINRRTVIIVELVEIPVLPAKPVLVGPALPAVMIL